MENITSSLIRSFYALEKWGWLLKELSESSGNIWGTVIKLLAFQSKIYDKRGNIERFGLSRYELSDKTTFGIGKLLPKYMQLEKKHSYSNININVIPEMQKSYLIIGFKERHISHAKKPTPIYILSLNGLIFALLFTNENFDHTEEIIKNHFEMMDYYNIPYNEDLSGALLKSFSKISHEKQKRYLQNFFDFISIKELDNEIMKEATKLERLIVDFERGFYYQFFLFPIFFPTDKEILEISRECWGGNDGIFRNSLGTIIKKHLEAFDLFQDKMFLPYEKGVQILATESRDDSTKALLFWIGREDNKFLVNEVFKKRLGVSNEKIDGIYARILNWAVLKFFEITNSNKDQDKKLLKEIIDSC